LQWLNLYDQNTSMLQTDNTRWHDPCHAVNNKKSPANAKRNARQRCTCEGPMQTKSKRTSMFHLDLTADDA